MRLVRAERTMPDPASPKRWLSIVGIGEDGIDGLSPVARGLVAGAEIVFGGERHLKLANQLIRGEAKPWPSPFSRAVSEVLAERGRQVCVLASGDPFFYGVGSVLANHVTPEETVVVPAPSAFSLAAARLGWALPNIALVSVHGHAGRLAGAHKFRDGLARFAATRPVHGECGGYMRARLQFEPPKRSVIRPAFTSALSASTNSPTGTSSLSRCMSENQKTE